MKIPKIVTDFIQSNHIACPNCDSAIEEKNMITIGINDYDISSNKRCETQMYLRYKCLKCGQITSFSLFNMPIEDFIMHMMYTDMSDDNEKEVKNDDVPEKKEDKNIKIVKPKPKSKISDEEVQSDRKEMDKCKNWTDLLRKMGTY